MQEDTATQIAFGIIATVIGLAAIWLTVKHCLKISSATTDLLPRFSDTHRPVLLNDIRTYESYQMHVLPESNTSQHRFEHRPILELSP
ncbi:hypothetical protein Slin15195_G099170 [Septoria linicola]|uniref:Uncharacterized protein n=1 Tax=Septoria linicola TaxID=215465 RepID=A0A9Q9EPJ7_9PEZI|nr:hypothetical protein Slin15195_G099170 [Septoria linicola]